MSDVLTTNKLVWEPPKGEILEIEDDVDLKFRSFSNFDIQVYPPSDHYYLDHDPDASSLYSFCIKNIRSPFTRTDINDVAASKKRTILQEWELLRTSLPNSIFVRAYSSRPELMRAAVMGLNDDSSPYRYGLFFFDIMLPAQYPAKPPQITFLFKGVALDVTRSVEVKTSVVQCLRVLQMAMVERGRRVKEGKRNELFVLSHKAMHNTMMDPPLGFRDLVNGYFRRFSHVILMQLKEYLESKDLKKSNGGGGERANGDKSTFVQLLSDFEENGSYCRHIKLDHTKSG